MSCKEITANAKNWANKYSPSLLDLINRDESYFEKIMNIEREKENPRKYYEKYSDIFDKVKFFYDDYYCELSKDTLPFNPMIDKNVIASVLKEFGDTLDLTLDEQGWFESLKALGEKYKFAPSGKIYKQNKDLYIGQVGDVAEMLRITLTTSKQSPNLYYILQVLGKEKVQSRIKSVIEMLKEA